MTRFRLKFIHAYIDRHGHPRHYFRRKGSRKIALPGLPGSSEFREAYEAALNSIEMPLKLKRAPGPISPRGGIDTLVSDYLASTAFLNLKPASKRAYRGILDRFRADHGHRGVNDLEADTVEKLVAAKASTPSGANNFRGVLHVLMNYAIKRGIRKDNPVTVDRLKIRGEGYHPWSDDEIVQFEGRHAIGTRARLAFALHLYTGQRRSDVIRMTWRSIDQGRIKLTQMKTGAKLEIPIHPKLQAALDAAPREHIAILVTQYGRSFTPDGYGGWFKRMTAKAGLPSECASHGLRKAAARRLAEAGATAHEIAAITGHASLSEVERYTKDANQAKLAGSGMGKLSGGEK